MIFSLWPIPPYPDDPRVARFLEWCDDAKRTFGGDDWDLPNRMALQGLVMMKAREFGLEMTPEGGLALQPDLQVPWYGGP